MIKKAFKSSRVIAILIACLAIIGSSVVAGSRHHDELTSLTFNKLSEMHFEDQVTHVSVTEGFIVVGQIRVPVVEKLTLRSGETFHTLIVDEKGGKIPLSQIRIFQRVHVYGYKTDSGFVFAEKIQRLALKKGDKTGPSAIPE
jgi:hypothetical protein